MEGNSKWVGEALGLCRSADIRAERIGRLLVGRIRVHHVIVFHTYIEKLGGRVLSCCFNIWVVAVIKCRKRISKERRQFFWSSRGGTGCSFFDRENGACLWASGIPRHCRHSCENGVWNERAMQRAEEWMLNWNYTWNKEERDRSCRNNQSRRCYSL